MDLGNCLLSRGAPITDRTGWVGNLHLIAKREIQSNSGGNSYRDSRSCDAWWLPRASTVEAISSAAGRQSASARSRTVDRKSVVSGKRVSVRVDFGGVSSINKKK